MPEPLPPAGVSEAGLYAALIGVAGEDAAAGWWRWLTVQWPGWAREGWGRLDDARASSCSPLF